MGHLDSACLKGNLISGNRLKSFANAIVAINKSFEPIGVPFLLS
jgi:hypothetical protein